MRNAVLASALALALGSAQAELVSVDYLAEGDGLLTLDSRTGLKWLDFTATTGLSASQINSGIGGWNSSFRFATENEATQLLSNAGLPMLENYNDDLIAPAMNFVSLFNTAGTSCPSGEPGFSFACAFLLNLTDMTGAINVGGSSSAGWGWGGIARLVTTTSGWGTTGQGPDGQSPNYGYAMVLTESAPPISSVPEPETYTLMLLSVGLLGLARCRGKQKVVA